MSSTASTRRAFDPVKIGTLYAILTGGEYNPSFISDTLCSGGEEGPWVFEVEDLGRRWAATEEFSPRFGNWPAERVHQQLGELAAIGRRAAGDGKALLMWMCL